MKTSLDFLMKRYKFIVLRGFAFEEVICASFIERNFKSQKEATEYARWMFGPYAIAEIDEREYNFPKFA
jgi:hypothetical protein